jgi:hypothetical protein
MRSMTWTEDKMTSTEDKSIEEKSFDENRKYFKLTHLISVGHARPRGTVPGAERTMTSGASPIRVPGGPGPEGALEARILPPEGSRPVAWHTISNALNSVLPTCFSAINRRSRCVAPAA